MLRTIGEEYEESDIVLADKDEETSLTLSLDDIEPKIHEVEDELNGLKETQDLLSKNHNALKEQKLVLQLGTKIYTKKDLGRSLAAPSVERSSATELMALSEFATTGSSLLGQVSGVIKKEQALSLERVLFRATRGNAVFETEPIEEQLLDVDSKGSNESVDKVFFMVLFAGEVMRDKISKICSYFGATLYKFPEAAEDLAAMSHEVEMRLGESEEILSKGAQVINELLLAFAANYQTWNFVVQKEKMVFDTLNMCEFDIKRHVFVAEGWVPCVQYETVVQALQDATTECGLDTRPIINKLDSRLTPPTYIPVTNFTSGFQALVNTYGTPRYREANPGAFCCIFFPFLFGIMFGDFGHGLILACFGYFLITKEKDWGDGAGLNDMVQMCYGGRYIILLNGIFGAYVGFMYNEAFAFPMNWFDGSRWFNEEDPSLGARWRGRQGADLRARPALPGGHRPDLALHGQQDHLLQLVQDEDLDHRRRDPDVGGHLPLAAQPHRVQGLQAHRLRVHPRDDLLRGHLRLPRLLHLLQVGASTGTATSACRATRARRPRPRCSRCSSTCSCRPRPTSTCRSTASSATSTAPRPPSDGKCGIAVVQTGVPRDVRHRRRRSRQALRGRQ